MTLKEQINNDFTEAYKAKEMVKKNFLGVLKGALQTQEGNQIPSTDENVVKVIKSIKKGILETIDAKNKLGTDVSDLEFELSILEPYLPKQMSEAEIRIIIKEILTRVDTNKNQGFLIGTFNKENNGKSFDNKIVAQIIKEELVK